MLEIRKGSASKSFENTFFREFADNLSQMFNHYGLEGVLLGNSVIEDRLDLQMDALLICNNQIIIIDFKNYEGIITLPGNAKNEFEFTSWKTFEGKSVSAGHESNRNPYMQVQKQKDKFVKILKECIIDELPLNDAINTSQIRTAICFQGKVELKREIPKLLQKYFFIFDKTNYLSQLKDILHTNEKDIKLSKTTFDIFKTNFKADEYKLNEEYSNYFEVNDFRSELDFNSLYQDQKTAVKEIEKFLENEEEKVFVLQGTSYSGKTHLAPFIKEIAFNNERQEVLYFASSARVANNLLRDSTLNFQSVYQHIYGGKTRIDDEHEENEESLTIEVVPLKENLDAEDTIYVVDEAQLVSNSYSQSLDLRFGSGHLLSDLLTFLNLAGTKRKLILLGDCFQVSADKQNENSLNPDFYSTVFELKSCAFQLLDKHNRTPIIDESLKLVDAIRSNCFNKLSIQNSDHIECLADEDIHEKVSEKILSNPNIHILCFSNSDAHKVNLWIKSKILRNGNDLATGDLLIINNNVKTQKDQHSEPKKLFNGEFARLIYAEDPKAIDGVKAPLYFRNLTIELLDKGYIVEMLALENYRNDPKGELSKDEVISLGIYLNSLAMNEVIKFKEGLYQPDKELKDLFKEEENGKKVKTKILKKIKRLLTNHPDTDYFKVQNALFIKYGWALTVHKARSYKWTEIFFNVETGSGKFNETYFKWYYTGLARAKSKVNLIKYHDINCYSKMEISALETLKGAIKDYFLIADKTVDLMISNIDIITKYHFPHNQHTSDLLQLYQLVENRIKSHNFSIQGISHNNYQEIYDIKNSQGDYIKISFTYNNKGQIGLPKLMHSNNKDVGQNMHKILQENSVLSNFEFITQDWRKIAYQELDDILKSINISFSYIIQTPYKDTVLFANDEHKALVEFNYDGDGFFTVVKSVYFTDNYFWEQIKNALNSLKP